MNKYTKILLGLATLWPFLYVILFFVFIFSTIFFVSDRAGEESGPPFFFAAFIAVHILTMIWIMGLTIFYMVNVFRNDRVDKDKKVLWAVVMFMGGMIAMPIYWYLYIWRESPVAVSPSAPSLARTDASSRVSDAGASSGEPTYVPPSQPPNWRE